MNLNYNTVDSFCQRIKVESRYPLIDMYNVDFIEPYALIYLRLFIKWHNDRGKYFEFREPRSHKVREYLNAQRFWERNSIMSRRTRFRATNQTSFNDIITIKKEDNVAEDISENIMEILSGNSTGRRTDISLVAEFASELVDNFVQHSEEEIAMCTLQLYPQAGRLDFAIGDCGIGIRSSLSQNPDYEYLKVRSHRDAAIKSFETNVSRRVEGGRGLTDSKEYVNELGGQIFLSTGDGWVLYRGTGTHSGTQAYNLSGVQIEVSLPLGG